MLVVFAGVVVAGLLTLDVRVPVVPRVPVLTTVAPSTVPASARAVSAPAVSVRGLHETHRRRGGAAPDGTTVDLSQPPGRPPRIRWTNVRDRSVDITLTPAAARAVGELLDAFGSHRTAAALDVAARHAIPGLPGRAPSA